MKSLLGQLHGPERIRLFPAQIQVNASEEQGVWPQNGAAAEPAFLSAALAADVTPAFAASVPGAAAPFAGSERWSLSVAPSFGAPAPAAALASRAPRSPERLAVAAVADIAFLLHCLPYSWEMRLGGEGG